MTSSRGPHLPAESVDVSGATFDDPERRRTRARHLTDAALVVAALAWIAVFIVGVMGSETNGIRASWFAIFPTGFGVVGSIAHTMGLPARTILLRALLAGALSTTGLWFFFEAIWPSL